MQITREKIKNRLDEAVALGRYRLEQVKFRGHAPPPSPVGVRIMRDLRRQGVAVTSLDELGFGSNRAMWKALEATNQELDRLSEAESKGHEYGSGFEHCTPVNPSAVAERFPDLYLWGLDPDLLDLVENILGLPAAYHGVCARKEIVDGKATGTRIWHQDTEDLNIIRVLVYMSDVTDVSCGPFEYVPRSEGLSYKNFRGLEDIRDADMRNVVPESRWRQCLGPKGTVIFGAVAKIFHHGRQPYSPRKVCSFYYTSRNPTNPSLCREYSFASGMPKLRVNLTPRQRACLWEYEKLLPQHAS